MSNKSLRETINESMDDFKNPMKQALKNTADDLKDDKGGCLKKVIIAIIVIMVLSLIANSCGGDEEETNNSNSSEPTSTIQQIENNNSEITSQDEDTDSKIESTHTENDDLAGEGAGEETKYGYLIWQNSYTATNDIELNDFTKEENKLNEKLDKISDTVYNITIDKGFTSSKYKITNKTTDFIYYGDIKDNMPNGVGILYKRSEVGYGRIELNDYYYNLFYVGSFDDGVYDGYGITFNQPEGNDFNAFQYCFDWDSEEEIDSNFYITYYDAWMNYADYQGEFSNGLRNGKGNSFYASLLDRTTYSNIIGKTYIENVCYDLIEVGTFKSGKLNGQSKVYTVGTLLYDGNMKNGEKQGKGRLYDNKGNLEYEGEFKNDMRHGKGTLYDANGKVVYEGEWKNDDYK